VLVINRHTLSDGEDFTEGYRTLSWARWSASRPPAGSSTLGHPPHRRHIGASAEHAHPRHARRGHGASSAAGRPLRRHPVGESYGGKDSQLDAAVEELMKELKR